ncbi:MAG TPA: methylated-DNA--[protein]-cysteine S-methyltransferase [Sediminibacterium sp.]|nr:methylated-DNA--[protein]-cysteine S-methyltransferase [Sediminibacterium sp.]
MMTDYERIARAIAYIQANFKEQPALEEVARQVYVSPFHFQRLFKEWAGVSPKKFLQFLSVEYAKRLLEKNQSLSAVSFETGLSSTSRLHDLFISIEGMSPAAYKRGGENLQIHYSFAETLFGNIIIASTLVGICHLSFTDSDSEGFENLKRQFPNARLLQKTDELQQKALQFFSGDWTDLSKVKLHLKGTDFQLKVWQSLLKIPFGGLSTYTAVAREIANDKAGRAVGTAIGNNPVAFLIPCHRVIRSTGFFGEYHWGVTRKSAIIGWEASQICGVE